jgi:hypothetical protein
MGNFSIQVSEFVSRTKGKMNLITRKIVLDIGTRLVERSPVDTGRFRANWQYATLGIGVPSFPVDRLDPTGADTIARIATQVRSMPAQNVHVLVNNLPYAIPLEQGWSKQAPYGMVGLTVLEFEAIVDGAAGEVADQ